MKKKLSIISFIAATVGMAFFSDNGIFVPAIVCIAYMIAWLLAQMKRPHAATRSQEKKVCETEILDFYSKAKTTKTQVGKVWTPDGKILTTVHIME